MPIIEIKLHVTMAAGEEWDVTADQRDFAKFEGSGLPEGRNLLLRHCGWTSSLRAGKTTMSWDQFADHCVQVDDREPDVEEVLDPTRPAPSGRS